MSSEELSPVDRVINVAINVAGYVLLACLVGAVCFAAAVLTMVAVRAMWRWAGFGEVAMDDWVVVAFVVLAVVVIANAVVQWGIASKRWAQACDANSRRRQEHKVLEERVTRRKKEYAALEERVKQMEGQTVVGEGPRLFALTTALDERVADLETQVKTTFTRVAGGMESADLKERVENLERKLYAVGEATRSG